MLKSGYSSIQAQIAVFLLSAFFHEVYYAYFKSGLVFYRLEALKETVFPHFPTKHCWFSLCFGDSCYQRFCFVLFSPVFVCFSSLRWSCVFFALCQEKKTFWEYGRKSRTLKKTNIEIRAWPMGKSSSHTGADPGFFSGGGALVSCSTSTPINHIFFFFGRIPVAPPAPSP